MFSIDCARCPSVQHGCEGCMISVLFGENSQVDALSEESCGYILAPEVRSAIEILVDVGLVSGLEILAVEHAA